MTCKYCGVVTDNGNGVCNNCNNKINRTPAEFEDIFSSSDKEIQKRANDIFVTKEPIPVSVTETTVKRQSTKKRTKRVTVIISLCTAFVAVIAICYALGMFNSSVAKIEEALISGKYKQAQELCVTEFETTGSKSLNKMLRNRLSDRYAEYCGGSAEFANVREEFTAIKNMNIAEVKPVAEDYLKKLTEVYNSKIAFADAEKQYALNQYAVAIANYKKVVKDDSNYAVSNEKLQQAILNYRNTALSEAATSVSDGDYVTAIKTLKTALVVLEKDEIVEKRITEYNKSLSSKSRQEIIDTAQKYVYRDEYVLAAKTIENAMETNEEFRNDEVLKVTYDNYVKQVESTLSANVDKIIESGDYTLAASTIKDAEELLGEQNIVITENKAKLSDNVPTYLDDLTPYSSENFTWGGSAVDSFGVDRSKESNHATLTTTSVVTFPVPQGYKKFKCNISASKTIDSAVKCRLRVTATVGGEYMYKECEISADKETQALEINVSDSTAVTLSVSGEGANIILYNALFEK